MNSATDEKDPQPSSADMIARHFGDGGKLLIGGEWIDAVSGDTMEVVDPANGSVIARIASGGSKDVDLAVRAARRAFEESRWPRLTPAQRAKLIWNLSDLLEKNADEIALIETLDNGKPLQASHVDVRTSVDNLRYHAGWTTKLVGETVASSDPRSLIAYTLREPVGVVGLITPWNYPIVNAVNKIAPALAAGCTVVLKPAEQTSLSALRLGELISEAGIPDGVVNIVTGLGHSAGAAIAEHPGVDKISFTGSGEVGRRILQASGGNFKRLTLELGGKSPVIIFPDANLDQAVTVAAARIFGNAGQICAANSRLYAHRDIFDRVVEGISDRAKSIVVGSGLDPRTEMGPIISKKQLERVMGYVDSGVSEGAFVAAGGKTLDRPGFFIEPTVLVNAHADMRAVKEEIFGPVLSAMSFKDDDLESVAAEANNTIYGLSAAIWTQNLAVAHALAQKLKAGMIRINGGSIDVALPFGGYKQSGFGREFGREGVEAFTEVKSVAIAGQRPDFIGL